MQCLEAEADLWNLRTLHLLCPKDMHNFYEKIGFNVQTFVFTAGETDKQNSNSELIPRTIRHEPVVN